MMHFQNTNIFLVKTQYFAASPSDLSGQSNFNHVCEKLAVIMRSWRNTIVGQTGSRREIELVQLTSQWSSDGSGGRWGGGANLY